MKKYKVLYSGFMYVEAEDSDEATLKAIDEDFVYQEIFEYNVIEVDDFVVMI